MGSFFMYELSLVPMSLFSDSGKGHCPNNKSTLRTKSKVEVSIRKDNTDALILDDCFVLYHIHWLTDAKVGYVILLIQYTQNYLPITSVYLIFDRYRNYSIKGQTRLERLGRYSQTQK